MQAVPLGFVLFLAELAAGGMVVTAVLDWDGEVSPGFLFLNSLFLLGFAAAAVWLRSLLPAARLLSYLPGEPWLQAEIGCWVAFSLATAVQLVVVKLERRTLSRAAALLAAALGIGALVVSAAAYRPPDVPVALLITSFLSAALALGTVWSGMMLGHWYLVTPRLAPRPLLRLNAALAAILIAQALVLLVGGLPGKLALSAAEPVATGPLAQFYWLRTGVGIVFPLALTVMVWRTARIRSMMSATGLLYVALGAILAGEIMAKSLFFITRVPL